ncbi:unnamed protein product [Ambrosiozyma monospora]|uniref:Unnamed protein product n=2 Tax=Ambrosiozyma monospora TaxID=43982 RepID=A0A9W6Z129_AMBMO|nr:unnamed protein product [Ambrosiozyma monospora]
MCNIIEGDSELVELKPGDKFPKLNYADALSKYGIDKPDLRSSLKFVDISSFFDGPVNPDFSVTEACVLKDALKYKKLPSQLFADNEYKVRKPHIFKITDENVLNTWLEKLPLKLKSEVDVKVLNTKLNLSVGDVVAISDRSELPYENPTPLGRFRQLAIQGFPNEWKRRIVSSSTQQEIPEDVFVATWVVNFPLFSPIEKEIASTEADKQQYPVYDFENFESTHHPFTMAKLEDYDLLATAPLKVKGDHYDLVVNGVEVGGGSRRVHDAELQNFIFTQILKIPNPMSLFGHLLHALSSGCPPHAGLAIGFDRMCSMLLGSSNIRDVVSFPKTQAGTDPVVESPSQVPEKTLDLYGVEVKK